MDATSKNGEWKDSLVEVLQDQGIDRVAGCEMR